MRKSTLALTAVLLVATTAIAGDTPIESIVLVDHEWANSSETCELSMDADSCELEKATKAHLRSNPVWVNPNP